MKKLVVLLAVAAGAVAANAAALNWGAAVCDPDGSSSVGADSVVYLIYSDTAFSGLASEYNTDTKTTNNGGTMVQSVTLTSNDADVNFTVSGKFVRADADGGVNGYYQLLLVAAADPTKFAVLDLGQVLGLSDTTSAGALNVNMDWSGSAFLGDSGYIGSVTGGGSSPIPEPTSGLLLILGVAGLALRRRRA